jgi:inner membrane protein
MMGALTHGLIDACTSYGTLLYWPISHHRESWDIISIIDPIFTLPLVLLTVITFVSRRPRFAQFAVVLCLLYLSLGIYQRGQATQLAAQLAEERGHRPEELSVRPSLANILLWRIVYRAGDQYYVDAVWTTPFSEPKQYPGSVVDAFSEASAQMIAPEGSVLADDIERFRFFSQGYLYRYLDEANVVADLRYAMFPDSIKPLWGIRMYPATPEVHVSMEYFRDPSQGSFDRLWRMIRGESVEALD